MFLIYPLLLDFQINSHKLIACQTDSSNTKSGKLQKLGGQKIFIFRGGDCPMRGRSEHFLFRGGCPIRMGGRGVIF